MERLEPRHLLSAQLDVSFGINGHVHDAGQASLEHSIYGTSVQFIAIQSDGRIIASGDADAPSAVNGSEVLMQRFMPDGGVDPTFRFEGITHSDSPPVIPQPDGKLILPLSSADEADVLERLNADGSRDETFTFHLAPALADDESFLNNDAALLPDGRIIVLGTSISLNGVPHALCVSRYLADGTPDPTFGDGGNVSMSVGSGMWLAVQPDGQLVVVYRSAGPKTASIMRLDANGEIDASFGQGGRVPLPDSIWDSFPQDVILVQPDGGIVVGLSNEATGGAVIRLTSDGGLDPRFGEGGRVQLPADVMPRSMLLAPDGKLVITCGNSSPIAVEGGITLLRLSPDGTRDESFGPGGTFRLPDTGWGWSQAALQGEKIVVLAAEFATDPAQFFHLARVFDVPEAAAETPDHGAAAPPAGSYSGAVIISQSSSDPLFEPASNELDWDVAEDVWA